MGGKVRRNEKGVTFIESILAVLLLGILMSWQGDFFINLYRNYLSFNKEVQLMNEAKVVEDFIREIIRTADKVIITGRADGRIIEVQSEDKQTLEGQEFDLVKIKGIQYLTSNQVKTVYIMLEPIISPSITQGKYRLVYRVGSESGTYNLISDQIETIKLFKSSQSNFIKFNMVFNQSDEINSEKRVIQVFTESLRYK